MELQLNLCHAGHQACAPKYGFGPAVRTHYILHYILRGRGWYRRAGQVYRLEENTVFLIRPGELTYYEADPLDPWEYCWVGFDGAHAPELLALCGLAAAPVRRSADPDARDTILAISKARARGRGSDIFYTGLLYQFFSYLAQPSPTAPPAPAKAYWAAAAEHIRKNYMYDITVSGVAAFVGVDRSYLYRLFRQYQGQSPQQYLLQCRVDAARELLLQTHYSVTEIAYSCGFKDVSTFGRAFRSLTGFSPTALRTAKK